MASYPTIGVEEEFLLADPTTGEPVAANTAVADRAAELGVKLQLELTSCQVETTSPVVSSAGDLREQLGRLRRVAANAAQVSGAQLLAVGLPPTVPHEFPITDSPRYREIGDKFGMIAHEQGISGCHVHVEVPSREAAVHVGNWLRPVLPLLLALTANSAVYRNADTGYSSWRSVLWGRWPSAGPPPHFETVAEYDATVRMLRDAGAILDDGMVYWDVRPSAKFPTLEVRVADVPATVAESVVLACLIRACVMTALDETPSAPRPPLTAQALKAAYWKSARDGLDGQAIDLVDSHRPRPARYLLECLVGRIRPALETAGDYDLVSTEIARIADEGNGAMRQRRAWRRRGDVRDVVAEAAAATLADT